MPLRSSPGSLRYFPTFIFSNSSLWELKCPVTLRTSKRHCCNFKDGLNSFFSLPVKENVLFIDTMQKAQHERWDWGGLGRHRGKKVVPSTASRDGGGGGDESGRWKSMSDAFKTKTVMKSYRVPASSGRMWNKRMQKSQWLSIGKWLSHASSLAGRGAVWNGESKGLNPDRGLPH